MVFETVNGFDCVTQRSSLCQIEGKRHNGKLALVADGDGNGSELEMVQRAQGRWPVVGNTSEVAGADDAAEVPVLDAAAAAVALALRDAVRPAVADPPAATP